MNNHTPSTPPSASNWHKLPISHPAADERKEQAKNSLLALPDDLLKYTLSFLDPRSASLASRACRTFFYLVYDGEAFEKSLLGRNLLSEFQSVENRLNCLIEEFELIDISKTTASTDIYQRILTQFHVLLSLHHSEKTYFSSKNSNKKETEAIITNIYNKAIKPAFTSIRGSNELSQTIATINDDSFLDGNTLLQFLLGRFHLKDQSASTGKLFSTLFEAFLKLKSQHRTEDAAQKLKTFDIHTYELFFLVKKSSSPVQWISPEPLLFEHILHVLSSNQTWFTVYSFEHINSCAAILDFYITQFPSEPVYNLTIDFLNNVDAGYIEFWIELLEKKSDKANNISLLFVLNLASDLSKGLHPGSIGTFTITQDHMDRLAQACKDLESRMEQVEKSRKASSSVKSKALKDKFLTFFKKK